ncbi:hypothetical protein FDB50_15160 [Clostridium botulinum]|uniref:DUF4315 family protein n=1 Tax=Clostridium botulinum TaxID=1491 RepID=A0A846JXF1_CLOBO|nr:hypothetical protein [Clostridium botulinum]NFN06042.1 hypothetical protein [Clostridium botulinum]NFN36378.1 hypothetical protein [Clostridium botulinum]HBJ1645857.1 hypothetical protein [Clostridium botulinum]
MEERKIKLLETKENIESKIKKYQEKLKSINHELKTIEFKEKSKSADEIVELLEGKGINDVQQFIQLMKEGKVNINNN